VARNARATPRASRWPGIGGKGKSSVMSQI
jgi:hypothetical protein